MHEIRKAFEQWFKTTNAYRMLESMNYFKMDLFEFIDAPRNEYRHPLVQVAFTTWQYRQGEIDNLEIKMSSQNQALHNVIEMEVKKNTEKEKQINQALNLINNWWHPDLDQKLFIEQVCKTLRGELE
ncbi:hypothetical protein KTH44_16220 [Acinetobacter bereziniae]|uniref:hypothetical protein n=1 Tax=Acinetobacter bereziniae TaxID=106648 RepID=UPI0021CD91E1|nr:hypothetical protein [Acinetobacter bereziniae]MCU4320663.1 hypothetical protein [Acinetobacter bereziniae]